MPHNRSAMGILKCATIATVGAVMYNLGPLSTAGIATLYPHLANTALQVAVTTTADTASSFFVCAWLLGVGYEYRDTIANGITGRQ